MRRYTVVIDPDAQADLDRLRSYIAREGSPASADRFLREILEYFRTFEVAPNRGTSRHDLRAGMRVIGMDRKLTILFSVNEEDSRVKILGIQYRGRDVAALFRDN